MTEILKQSVTLTGFVFVMFAMIPNQAPAIHALLFITGITAGMLPLLAHSRKAFIKVKAVNFAIGLVLGAAGLAMGL